MGRSNLPLWNYFIGLLSSQQYSRPNATAGTFEGEKFSKDFSFPSSRFNLLECPVATVLIVKKWLKRFVKGNDVLFQKNLESLPYLFCEKHNRQFSETRWTRFVYFWVLTHLLEAVVATVFTGAGSFKRDLKDTFVLFQSTFEPFLSLVCECHNHGVCHSHHLPPLQRILSSFVKEGDWARKVWKQTTSDCP